MSQNAWNLAFLLFFTVCQKTEYQAILNTLAIQVTLPSTVSLPFFEGQEVHCGSTGPRRALGAAGSPAGWTPPRPRPALPPSLGSHTLVTGSQPWLNIGITLEVSTVQSGSHPQGFSWNRRGVRPGHLDFKSAPSDSKVQSGWRNPAQTTVG